MTKRFRGLFQKYNKKSVLTVFAAGALAMVLVAGTVVAEGPTFNIFPVAYDGSLNTDYPLIDGRNVTSGEGWSTSQYDHDQGVAANPGDEIEFLVYYHNGAPDSSANTALSTIVRASVPGAASNLFTVGASISASNAQSVSSTSRGGDMTLRVSGSKAQTLSLVPGTTVWLPDRASRSQTMSDTVTGSGVNLGDIRGCWQYSGYLKFRVRVSQNVDTFGLNIIKDVRRAGTADSYADQISANPGDTVEFRITGTNTGTGVVSHVFLSDTLPSRLTYVPGSLTVSQTSLSGGLFSDGLDTGSVNAGASVSAVFRATVASAGQFTPGTTSLDNNSSIWGQGPNVATASDTARVNVTINPPQNCTLSVRATLNGAAWSGSLNYSASGPVAVSDSTVPKDFTVNAGTYVANYISGGPSGTFSGISPSSGNCPAGGSLTFVYNFSRVDVRDLIIDKVVKNVTMGTAYADSVSAQPSQIVEYKIEIRNTGNATIDDLRSRDILPQKTTFISGSMTVNGSASSNEDCFASYSGCNFGPLLASESKTIIFRGQLAGTNEFSVGNTALINTAYAWSSSIAEKNDAATVNVNKSLVKENGSPAGRPQ